VPPDVLEALLDEDGSRVQIDLGPVKAEQLPRLHTRQVRVVEDEQDVLGAEHLPAVQPHQHVAALLAGRKADWRSEGG
jgi:hypothetical protein